MESAGTVIKICWVVYLAYWFLSAMSVKPVAERQRWPDRLAYRLPSLLGGILLIWSGRLPGMLEAISTPTTELARNLGAALCVAGLAVAIWARRTLAGNWSSTVTFKQGHELIARGPYRFVRHPIYTGILLLCVGTAIARGRLGAWLGVGLLCAGFWIKLKQEEALMLRHFPETYPDYRKRVKALLPFVI